MDLAMREDLEIAIEDFVDDNYEDAVVEQIWNLSLNMKLVNMKLR